MSAWLTTASVIWKRRKSSELEGAAYAGLTAADLTTWESVGALLCNAVRNPYCLFLVLSSVWNAVNDPTTKGVADSERARQYTIPQK